MENTESIIIENMSIPQKGRVRVLVLRDDERCVDEFGNVYKVVPVNREDRQPMYEELIKELRKESCGAKTTTWWRAADAIEELSKLNAEITRREIKLRMDKPRWIPMTERLPEKAGAYLVCETWDNGYGVMYNISVDSYSLNLNKVDEYDFHGKEYKRPGWFDYDSEHGHFETGEDITHWMPLPTPPKEETE